MNTYIQDPNDPAKVIDTTILPPSIDVVEIAQAIIILRNKADTMQTILDAIYQQVPPIQQVVENAGLADNNQ